jgi:hypothetical protein
MATIEVKLKPFNVPNHALVEEPARPKQEGIQELRSIPISELPAATLQAMAADWLASLYDKAGKPHNWRFD